MGKGYVSPEMFAGRISAAGKVTDLTESFKVSGGVPFALFIIEKASKSNDPVLVDCTLYQGDSAGDCPFTPNCWDVPAVTEISANGIDLALYDVYYGTGADIQEDDQ